MQGLIVSWVQQGLKMTNRELFILYVPSDAPLSVWNKLAAARWAEIDKRGLHGNLIIKPESMRPKHKNRGNPGKVVSHD